MKKYLLIIGFILTLNGSMYGHTGYPDTVLCPVCGDTVVFHLTMSMTTFGSYLDFQKQGAIGYYYEEMINACHNCYYSGYYDDFDTTFTESYIDSIKTVATKYKGKEIEDVLECEIAAEIKMLSDFRNDQIANIYLIASYFIRANSVQIERRKNMQRNTIRFLSEAISNDEYEKDVIATINYLIGELYRRTGDFEKAILHYDLAINDKKKQDWVEEIVEKQKELALKKDDDNNI